jgi:hypothetical protein
MLRVSAKINDEDVDIRGVGGDATSAAQGVAFGAELMQFAEAVASRDAAALPRARDALLATAGPTVLVDAAAVAANFQRMVRIADAIGIPYDRADADMAIAVREELGLARFESARHTFGNEPG